MSESTQFIGLGYDQALLVPGASNVLPHTVSLASHLSPNFKLNIPLISEAYDAETDQRVVPIALNGGLGIFVQQESVDEQVELVKSAKATVIDEQKFPNALTDEQGKLVVGAEVWLGAEANQRVDALINAGVNAIFFYLHADLDDSATAIIKATKQTHPELLVAVGVVEDPDVAAQIYEAGADAVLAGRCVNSPLPNDLTYPFLTVTMGIADVASNYDNKSVIAVGGVHYSGDVVKALAAGADATLVSDLLKGEVLEADGSFKGGDMAIDDAIFQTDGGLRAGMGYTGSATIQDLKLRAKFVQITDNGLRESHPHDVEITKQAPNYAKG